MHHGEDEQDVGNHHDPIDPERATEVIRSDLHDPTKAQNDEHQEQRAEDAGVQEIAFVQIDLRRHLQLVTPAVAEDVAAEKTQQASPIDQVLHDRGGAVASRDGYGRVLDEQAWQTQRSTGDERRAERCKRIPVPSGNEIASVDEQEDDVIAELLEEGEVELDGDEQRQSDEATQPVASGRGVNKIEKDWCG